MRPEVRRLFLVIFCGFIRVTLQPNFDAAHPPPPPHFSLTSAPLPPASSDGSVCVIVHAQKHAGMLVGFSHGVVSKAQTGSSETFHVGMRVCVRVCYTNHLRLCSRAWHCTLHCVVMCSRRPLTFFLTHVCDATVTCRTERTCACVCFFGTAHLRFFWQSRAHTFHRHI